ncbi:hypothetical protein RRG08_055066 [Elysia crispata]|uniref:Uncharacterized protein n=1 Tax=Elysia crispata TaxID=231223 RepID=A0AAE1E828_9GAST|nr:hypothetical protein RRG08_055066 [Elysia crispata]
MNPSVLQAGCGMRSTPEMSSTPRSSWARIVTAEDVGIKLDQVRHGSSCLMIRSNTAVEANSRVLFKMTSPSVLRWTSEMRQTSSTHESIASPCLSQTSEMRQTSSVLTSPLSPLVSRVLPLRPSSHPAIPGSSTRLTPHHTAIEPPSEGAPAVCSTDYSRPRSTASVSLVSPHAFHSTHPHTHKQASEMGSAGARRRQPVNPARSGASTCRPA